jgi:CHAT domain-containing protein
LPKHTILFLAANPVGTDRLELDREARAVQIELEASSYRNHFDLQTRWAVQPRDLLRALRRLKPTVVHFSGHGGQRSAGTAEVDRPNRDVNLDTNLANPERLDGLFFQGADGQAQLVTGQALQDTFGAAGASVRLVVLSACHSNLQAEALRIHVDCVVGMTGSVGDDAARYFSTGFYGGLGDGGSIASAFRQGCAAISLEGVLDRDRPQLHVRDGVDATKLVLGAAKNQADPHKAKTGESQKRQADLKTFDAILDLFATRRAFFHGDEAALEHVLRMLDYRDAGRAVAVARSLAEVAGKVEAELWGLRGSTHPSLKGALSRLSVACKDYVEVHGRRPDEGFLPLPHIGWGQRIEDFTRVDHRFGFSSLDSVKTFKEVLAYIARSFRDLLLVRTRAMEVLDGLAETEPALTERSDDVRALLSKGSEYLKNAIAALDRGVNLVDEVISSSSDLKTRTAKAAALAQAEGDQITARILNAVSKLRRSEAWSRRSPATTLVVVEVVSDDKLRLGFADGLNTYVVLDEDYWETHQGMSMDADGFRLARLNADANVVEWDADAGIYLTGELLRRICGGA